MVKIFRYNMKINRYIMKIWKKKSLKIIENQEKYGKM